MCTCTANQYLKRRPDSINVGATFDQPPLNHRGKGRKMERETKEVAGLQKRPKCIRTSQCVSVDGALLHWPLCIIAWVDILAQNTLTFR